jgi:drug/metabolite transporter (DMT)-like permease
VILRPLATMAVAPEVIWLSILNATLCTFLPVLLVMLAIERVGAGVAAQTGLIGPLSTIMLSVVLLDEPFTLWMAVGTVLVLAGIWLITKSKQAKPAPSGSAPPG